MSKILVVANETVGADELLSELRRLEDEKTSDYYVIVPARPLHERHGTVWTQEGAIEAAEDRLQQTLDVLRTEGLERRRPRRRHAPAARHQRRTDGLQGRPDRDLDASREAIAMDAARPRRAGGAPLLEARHPRRLDGRAPFRTDREPGPATRTALRRIALHGEHHAESRHRRAVRSDQRANGGAGTDAPCVRRGLPPPHVGRHARRPLGRGAVRRDRRRLRPRRPARCRAARRARVQPDAAGRRLLAAGLGARDEHARLAVPGRLRVGRARRAGPDGAREDPPRDRRRARRRGPHRAPCCTRARPTHASRSCTSSSSASSRARS